jgi:thiol-disulfide isomerase/thioredoxin
MKNFLLTFFLFSFFSYTSKAQLADGTIAPDFTVTDINGNVHNLYTYLDAGKHVVLDFSATWCGPCWNYHNTQAIKNLYNAHGPNGSNTMMVIKIEADLSTAEACLYGNCMGMGGTTQGNWVAGTPYPIVNLTSNNAPGLAGQYQIGYYPTLYGIDADDKRIFEVGQKSMASWETWLFESFAMTVSETFTEGTCPQTSQIALGVTEGYNSITYDWSNGANTPVISNLSNGTYSCEISDANGYFLETDVYVVDGPEDFDIQANVVQDVLCHATESGQIIVSASGGTGNISYSWSNGATGANNNFIAAGDYTVTITDAVGCNDTESYTITEPPLFEVFTEVVQPSCDEEDGTVLFVASGGTPPFNYELGPLVQNQPYFTGLAGGNYDYTLIDNNNCIIAASIDLETSTSPIATSAPLNAISCSTPQAQVSGAGSSSGPNFTYQWTTTDGNIVSGDNQLLLNVNEAGTYTLLVTNNANGCFSTSSAVVESNAVLPNLSIQSPAAIDCDTDEVVINASQSQSGTGITYQWTTTNGNIVSGATTLTPTVDEAGTYQLLITNSNNGCTSTGTTSVVIDQVAPTVSVPSGSLNCGQPEIQLCATGTGVSFSWDVPNDNDQACISVTQGGTYTVTTTGTNGCTAVASSIVTVSNDLPQVSSEVPAELTCAVSEVTISADVEGDDSAYSYLWTTQDGQIVSGENTLTPTVSAVGLYVLQTTNLASGCTSTLEVTVNESRDLPMAEFTSSLGNFEVNVSVDVVEENVTYLWDFGNGTTSDLPEATGVYTAPGTYTICLTVTNDCGATTICEDVSFSSVLQVSSTKEDLSCFESQDGTISVIVLGGQAPITVAWTGPDGFASTDFELTGLSVGTHNAVVTDASNSTQELTFEINQPHALAIASSSIINDSNNQNSGAINLITEGGVGSYTYLWSNGATTEDISGLSAGEYSVVIKDENGCEKTFGPFVVQNVSGINEAEYVNHFKVYPNPTSNILNIDVQLLQAQAGKIKITNSLGVLLSTQDFMSSLSQRIHVDQLANGLYLVEVEGQNFNITKRIIIMK